MIKSTTDHDPSTFRDQKLESKNNNKLLTSRHRFQVTSESIIGSHAFTCSDRFEADPLFGSPQLHASPTRLFDQAFDEMELMIAADDTCRWQHSCSSLRRPDRCGLFISFVCGSSAFD